MDPLIKLIIASIVCASTIVASIMIGKNANKPATITDQATYNRELIGSEIIWFSNNTITPSEDDENSSVISLYQFPSPADILDDTFIPDMEEEENRMVQIMKYEESPIMSNKLTFMSGNDKGGMVVLDLNDGSVEFVNCTPPESGRIFWESISNAYKDLGIQITK